MVNIQAIEIIKSNYHTDMTLDTATKSVWQFHDKKDELRQVFDYFRHAVNEAIRIGDENNITSLKELNRETYHEIKGEFYSRYTAEAVKFAKSKLKQFRTAKKKNSNSKRPYVMRDVFELDNQAYNIRDDSIEIPIRPGEPRLKIKLCSYVLDKIQDVKLGSITITPDKLIIPYSKEVEIQTTQEGIGVDRNLNNVTTFDGKKATVYDMEKPTKIIQTYRDITSHFKRNDRRIQKKIKAKYGKRQKNRVNNIIHVVTKTISSEGKGVILDDLTGVRNEYRKGKKYKDLRSKINSWSFYEFQRQLEYKCRWNGLPLIIVDAQDTSTKCSVCEADLVLEERRMMRCVKCKIHVDRDVNASVNILYKGMEEHAGGARVTPDGGAREAMVPRARSVDASNISRVIRVSM